MLKARTIAIHPETLAYLGQTRPAENTGLAKFTRVLSALHYGTWGGDLNRYLWAALGLASATLAFVGASIFAARTAETTQVSGRGIARYWRGLGLLRWLYLIVLAGIIAMFFLRVVLG